MPEPIVQWCNDVAEEMVHPSYFCTGDWLSSASRFEKTIHIIAVYDQLNNELVAVLPLAHRRNLLGGIYGFFIGSRFHPDPLGLVCKKNRLKESAYAIRHYFEYNLNWDSIILDWTTEEECEAWGVKYENVTVAPYLSINSSFEGVLKEFRKKKRYNIKSSVKQLITNRGASYTECLALQDKVNCLKDLVTLHRIRAKERVIKSTVDGPSFFKHHSHLIQTSPSAKIFKLSLEGKTIAVVYGFSYACRFFYYQVAHDPSYGYLSPGKVLLYLVIKHFCDLGFKEFNFLQGDEEYKGLWTSDKRKLVRMRLDKRNLRTFIFQVVKFTKRRLKIFIGV